MVREKDRFWEYVEDLNGRFLCKFCKKSFAGGIPRIKSHLSGVRGRDIEICGKVPEDVRIAALQAICSPKKKARSLISSNNDLETAIVSTSAPKKKAKGSHQPTDLRVCEKDQSLAHKLLAKFIISNNLSPDVSKTPFLGDLLKSIAEIGSSYRRPKYSDLKSQLMLGVHKEIEEYVGNVKNFLTTTGCTLIMSKVVQNSKLVCMNFFASTPGGLVYVDKITVPEEGMSFHHFIDSISSMIESLGPEHVVQVILDDSDDSMVDYFADFKEHFFNKVVEMIIPKYPWIHPSKCANGELGALLLLIYIDVAWIHKTTQMAKLIFKFLYKHDIPLLPRKEHTRTKEYNRGGLAKIAIELFMLNSILDAQKELQALQLPIVSASGVQEGSSSVDDVAEVVNKAIHSTEFWSNGKNVVQVLKPLFQVLEFINGNGSTLGYLYEAMKRVEEALEQYFDSDDRIRKVFKAWRTRVVRPIHVVGAFLNPAYMCSQKFSEDTEIKMGLKVLMLLVPNFEREALSNQVQLYRMKASDLFTAAAVKMLNTVHPRKWWECCGEHYPILQKIAIRLSSQTCSTSLCDHISFQQNALNDEFSMNMIMMEKFSALKSQNLEPIDLDRIIGLPEYGHEYVERFLEDLDWSDNIDYHGLLVMNNSSDRVCTQSDDGDETFFEDLDWSDIIEFCDLLEIDVTSYRVCAPTDSNDCDDSSKNIFQKNWRYILSEFNNHNELSDIINQYWV